MPIRFLSSQNLSHPSKRRLLAFLLLGVCASFAFGFALVPIYSVFCKLTGLNGKFPSYSQGALATKAPPRFDPARLVTVDFTGTVMPGLAWDMRPLVARRDLHPGELQQVKYRVHNHSDHPIVGQAVPSISPGQAAQYFQKLDCFCFKQQTLAPGETRELPLTFVVKPEISGDIQQITLSYAFYSAEASR